MQIDAFTRSAASIEALRGIARLGVKGPDAAQLLAEAGLPVPASPNSVICLDPARHAGGGRCLRLGNSEFLVEQDVSDEAILALQLTLTTTALRAWPALRCDRSLVLRGPDTRALLLQICDFDFTTLEAAPHTAVMTLMAGISVIIARDDKAAMPGIRIWCDPGFGDYLHDCLLTLLNATGTPA
ncbi:MAG: sarcosine oxidase subunit gamma [Pseudomonadota bacterium]